MRSGRKSLDNPLMSFRGALFAPRNLVRRMQTRLLASLKVTICTSPVKCTPLCQGLCKVGHGRLKPQQSQAFTPFAVLRVSSLMRERLRHIPEAALRRLECSLRRQACRGESLFARTCCCDFESPGGLLSAFAHALPLCLSRLPFWTIISPV
jgi:hypothetical protein